MSSSSSPTVSSTSRCEIDPGVTLAPDEEIEVFRIVQEGLANARKHAGRAQRRGLDRAARARGSCGSQTTVPASRASTGAGQGLKNMRARAASIEGVFSLRSSPGQGTSIEVVLRPI